MRILHLAKYYWPRSGGMERVVQTLAEGASNLGHQVEVVAVESLGRSGETGRHRSLVTRAFSCEPSAAKEKARVTADRCRPASPLRPRLSTATTSTWCPRLDAPSTRVCTTRSIPPDRGQSYFARCRMRMTRANLGCLERPLGLYSAVVPATSPEIPIAVNLRNPLATSPRLCQATPLREPSRRTEAITCAR